MGYSIHDNKSKKSTPLNKCLKFIHERVEKMYLLR